MEYPPLPAPLILATRSPRRIELARRMGLAFSAVPSDIDEVREPGEPAVVFAERMARDKARPVAVRHPESIIIGCDTIVVIEDDVLGKPSDAADARAMLRRLSGHEHRVMSGLALIWEARSLEKAFVETTFVRFRTMTDDEIDGYVAGGEPMDKAGAYAIQGGARDFVVDISGSCDNVVGFPTERLDAELRRLILQNTCEGA